jgi:hypothetical protein
MGLILKLPFEGGKRKIEVDSGRNIVFLDYDVAYEQAFAAMGGNESEEAKLARLYAARGVLAFMDPASSWRHDDPDSFDRDTCKDWTMRFVQALKKQGIEKYGTGRIADTLQDIARMIADSDLFEHDEFEGLKPYIDELADDEDEAVSWILAWLEEAVDNSTRYEGSDGAFAKLLAEYLSDGDAVATVDEILYYGDDHSYENTDGWRFTISVRDQTLFSWTEARRAVIWNPVTFAGGEDTDYQDESDVEKREKADSLADALGISIPDVREPELPDHPTSDEAGDFAVLYEFGDDYSCNDDRCSWEVVSYATQREADDAMELSGDIFNDMGDEGNVEMTLLRRLTPDEKYEHDMAKRQGGLFNEDEEPGWHDDWTPWTPPESA